MGHRNVSVMVFYTDGGMLLLQDRSGISKFGEEWTFFGGGIEEMETPKDAILRELREEIGYEPPEMEFFKQYDYKIGKDASRTQYVFMAKSPRPQDLVVKEGKGARLFTIHEALRLKLFPFDDVVIEEFAKDKGFIESQ